MTDTLEVARYSTQIGIYKGSNTERSIDAGIHKIRERSDDLLYS